MHYVYVIATGMIIPYAIAPTEHPMKGMRMRSHSLCHKDIVVCPYAVGFRRHIRCNVINCLPVDLVFRLCGRDFSGCDEFRLLRRKELRGSPQTRRKARILGRRDSA